ncbi:MAG: autotransporter domain-containing protein, partial [Chlamydiota bacterium]
NIGGFFSTDLGFFCNYIPFFELFGSVGYNYLHQGEYDEEGTCSLDLRLLSRDDHLLRSEVGGRFKTDLPLNESSVQFFAGASWVYKTPLENGLYKSKFVDFSANSSDLVVRTFDKSISFISPEVGIEHIRDYVSFSIFYQGEFGKGYTTNQVALKAAYNF